MAEETLKVKIVVDNQASSAITNIKKQFNNTKQKTNETSTSIDRVVKNLNVVKRVNLVGLAKQFDFVKRSCKTSALAASRYKDAIDSIKKHWKSYKDFVKTPFYQDFDFWTKTKDRIGNLGTAISLTGKRTVKLLNDWRRILKVIIGHYGEILRKITSIIAPLLMIKFLINEIKSAIKVAANADEVADNAQKVFMSTTAYQEWGYALKQNGIEISQLNTAMRTFGKNVTSNSALMNKYGIHAKSVSYAFEKAVEKIQNMESETEKIAAATELFGNRASQLMPILNSDSKAIKDLMDTYRMIGGTMSDQIISKGDILTDSIVELKAAWQGLKNTLAIGFMPIITNIVQGLSYAIAKVRLLIKAVFGIKETFSGTNNSASDLSTNLDAAAGSAGKLKRILMGYDELNRLEGSDGSGGIGGILPDTEDIEYLGNVINNSDLLEKLKTFKIKLEDLHVEEAFAKARKSISETWDTFKKDYEENGFSIKSFVKLVIGVVKPIVDALDEIGVGDAIKKALIAGVAIFSATGSLKAGLVATIVSGLLLSIVSITADNKTKETIDTICKTLIDILPMAVGILLFSKTGNLWTAAIGTILTIAISKIRAKNDSKESADSLSDLLIGILPITVGVLTFLRTGNIWSAVLAASLTFSVSKILLDNKTGETVESFVGKVANMLKSAALGGILGGIAGLVLGGPGGAMLGFKIGATLSIVFESIEANYDKVKGQIQDAGTIVKGYGNNNGVNGYDTSWSTPTGIANSYKANGSGATETLNALKKQGSNVGTAIEAMLSAGFNSSSLQLGLKKSNFKVSESELSRLRKIYGFAEGGVLKTPTLGLLAEYSNARSNPEIIAPQSVLKHTIDASNGELANAFAQGVRQIVSAIESKDDTVIIGEETIARAAGKGNASHIKRTGVSLI